MNFRLAALLLFTTLNAALADETAKAVVVKSVPCDGTANLRDVLADSTLEMLKPIGLSKDYAYTHEVYNDERYGVAFIGGAQSPYDTGKQVINRSISIHFSGKTTKDPVLFKKGWMKPFKCKIETPVSEVEWFKKLGLKGGDFSTLVVGFEKNCPATELRIRRASLDPRYWPIDVKAFRYNFGSNFKFDAKCAAQAKTKTK